MLTIFETQIHNEDRIVLKHRNVEQLHFLMNTLSDTLMTTTDTELNLGMKTRDLEYSQHEFKMLKCHYEHLQKNFDAMKLELQNSKLTIKDMQYREKDSLKDLVTIRKANKQMEVRTQGLTDGLNFIQENSEFVDQENKLKNTIFILMRENKQLKSQLYQAGLSDHNPS